MNTNDDIKVGDFVRSFDFRHLQRDLDGPHACYLEGQVESIETLAGGGDCLRYKVRITRWIFGGKPLTDHPDYAYPPVNGVRIAGSSELTDFVVRIPPFREDGR